MAPSLSDFSVLSPESLNESLDGTIEDDAPPGVDEEGENSTAPLRRKIEEIKLEKFDAKAKIAQSKVLTQTIRTIGVQQLNFDVETAGNEIVRLNRLDSSINYNKRQCEPFSSKVR